MPICAGTDGCGMNTCANVRAEPGSGMSAIAAATANETTSTTTASCQTFMAPSIAETPGRGGNSDPKAKHGTTS